MENTLLLDIGNSNIKAAIADNTGIRKEAKSYPYEKNNFRRDFINIINHYAVNEIKDINTAGISIVNESQKLIIANTLLTKFAVHPFFVNNSLKKLPVKLAYKSALGNDRLCSISAAYTLYKKRAVLVIDFGTATTYNLIVNGVFKGGIISPGILTSLKSLTQNSSLPEVELIFNKNIIADNTVDAIINGSLFPALYTAERIIKDIKKKYAQIFVIATGGLAEIIKNETKLINVTDKDLVLKGIKILNDLNEGRD